MGNQCLGCVLEGLDPNYPPFCTAPPHFSVVLEYEKEREGAKLAFGKVLEFLNKSGSEIITSFLLLSLSSIIYRYKELRNFFYDISNHDFHIWRCCIIKNSLMTYRS